MSYQDIELERTGPVAVIRLNRPDHLNAFTGEMGRELGNAYAAADSDEDVRVVVLTGAGSAFCAGADFSGGAGIFDAQPESEFSADGGVSPPAFAIRKPVVAAVNGHAVGIGLSLAMQCDIRIFAEEGKYGFLHARRGVMPDAYAHFTVPRCAGFTTAADLFLTARKFDGAEAERLGLATLVAPASRVLADAMEIAGAIARDVAPMSAAATKALLWESAERTPREIEERETALHHVLMNGPDAIEGALAYIEKRPAAWKARLAGDWPAAERALRAAKRGHGDDVED